MFKHANSACAFARAMGIALSVALVGGCAIQRPADTGISEAKADSVHLLTFEDDIAYVDSGEKNLNAAIGWRKAENYGLIAGTVGTAVPAAAGGLLGFSKNFVTRFTLAAGVLAGIDTTEAPNAQIAIINLEMPVLACIESQLNVLNGQDASLLTDARAIAPTKQLFDIAWNDSKFAIKTIKDDRNGTNRDYRISQIAIIQSHLTEDWYQIRGYEAPLAVLADTVKAAVDQVILQTNTQLDAKMPDAKAYMTMINALNVKSGATDGVKISSPAGTGAGTATGMALEALGVATTVTHAERDRMSIFERLKDDVDKLDAAIGKLQTPAKADEKTLDISTCVVASK